jgi:hypothetical protein
MACWLISFEQLLLFCYLMCHCLFIHSPTEGHVGCFQGLAIVNKAAVNICVQVFEKTNFQLISGK